jgi:chromosome segregation protein
MFLKSLLLRGFKSFPDKTTLVFEPGITTIVGPNGSGKSNVVDAISWVLGEQGPRSLRGGRMEDVIFAGSRLRPALGMAEVSLTIDNSSGVLPIEFSEVTISRILFRSGDSEYRLNGQPCRLLDIQEVLSDSGIGRQQHTIIGQGQLDEILQADPMQTRGFIEEAAGVTKHRRRKERALRKMAATEHNLSRLSDLLAEIRRQLRPLREQAEVAKRHAAAAEELSRVATIQGARELAMLRDRLGPGALGDPDAPVREKEEELSALETRLSDAETHRTASFAAVEKSRETAWRLARAQERLVGLGKLARERVDGLSSRLEGTTEAAARARAVEVEREMAETRVLLENAERSLRETELSSHEALSEAEVASADVDRIDATLAPLRAAHREMLAEAVRVRGEIGALERSLESAERETERIEGRRRQLERAAEEISESLEGVQARVSELEGNEATAARAVEEWETRAAGLASRLEEAEARAGRAEVEVAVWEARAGARRSGGAEAARRAAGVDGVAGVLGDLVEVPEELRRAVEAVAGPPEAVVVAERAEVIRLLFTQESADAPAVLIASDGPAAPLVQGSQALSDLLRIESPAVRRALGSVFLAGDAAEAARLAAAHPECVFVTRDGVLASGNAVIASASDAAANAADARRRLAAEKSELAKAAEELAGARARLSEAAGRLNEADAALAAAADDVTAQDREFHALQREIAAVSESGDQARRAAERLAERLHALRSELPEIEGRVQAGDLELSRFQEDHGRAAARREAASSSLERARISNAAAGERRSLLAERMGSLESAHEESIAAAESVGDERLRISGALEQAELISTTAGTLARRVEDWAAEAEVAYQAQRRALDEAESAVAGLRTERAGLAGAIEDLRVEVRRDDVRRSELTVRARILEERFHSEWGIEPEQAVSRFGRPWEVEDEARITDALEKLALLGDDALARRRVRLERDLESMGGINPLAAQEFDSLTEREKFLGEQIADVRSSRRHLLKLVGSIDERIRELFVQAYEDVSGEYERLFVMLFPGGNGRLRMTDPADLLETGIEIEARPGGKNLRRLSLLSGGEKALSALAFLFAIFRARPSPFYVLDEVEAALDDVNLHRFLQLLLEFRRTSQLLVVTHQKRTMEIGDVLYGVSIRPDGSSRVISEKLPAGDVPELPRSPVGPGA